MKKILAAIFALLVCSAIGYSQKSFTNSHFAISAGPSFPIGHFPDKNLLSDKSGLAGIGQALAISYAIRSEKPVGFLFELRGQRNPVSKKAVEKELARTPFRDVGIITPGPNPAPVSYTVYDPWNVKKSTWWSASLSAGLFYSAPAFNSGRTTLNAKALVGGIYAKSPKFEASSINELNAYTIKQSDESAFGFTYTLGADLFIYGKRRSFLIIGVEYAGTERLTFDDVDVLAYGRRGPAAELSTVYWEERHRANGLQTMSTINVMLGIGFRVGK